MMESVEVRPSSGNIFADLDLPYAEQRYDKAMISRAIAREINARGLTQAQAAELLGTTQPEMSAVIRGELAGFSMQGLSDFAAALGLNGHVNG